MEQEPTNYRSKEEEIAAKEFNNQQLDSNDDERIDELMLEQLENFQRMPTEQFAATRHNLEVFTKEISEKYSADDQREIYDALMLMFSLHIYQEDRPDSSPYVSHPLIVARKAAELPQSPDKSLVIAALLHDAVEDQADKLSSIYDQKTEGLTDEQRALLEIQRKYGDKVENLISHLSNPDFDMILEKQGIRPENPHYRELKNQLYAKHVAESIEDHDVLVIKLSDFSENALNLSALPDGTEQQKEKKQTLINKYVPVMKIFIDRLQRDNLFPEYQEKLIKEYQKFVK